MDIKKILEYQEKDFEIIKLERNLENNEDRKIFTKMLAEVKDAQTKSTNLEKEANTILEDYKKLEATYNDNLKSAGVILNTNLDKSTDDNLSSAGEVASNILNNLSILEKKLMFEAERVNAILTNFEQTKKKYAESKSKYFEHKKAFESYQSEIQPQIDAKKEEIKKLEKAIDKEIFAKYKQRRQDKIYPVFVPMVGTSCGGCRMELPSASLDKLKSQGFLECEHCRRIMYYVG